jgi:hypothetical protein
VCSVKRWNPDLVRAGKDRKPVRPGETSCPDPTVGNQPSEGGEPLPPTSFRSPGTPDNAKVERRCGKTMRRTSRALLAATLVAVALLANALPAAAGPANEVAATVTSLNQVMNSITVWLTGLLGGLATLLLTLGGVRYLLGAGDPGEVMRAKETLKYAAVGYGVAVLAPLLLTILKGFVG